MGAILRTEAGKQAADPMPSGVDVYLSGHSQQLFEPGEPRDRIEVGTIGRQEQEEELGAGADGFLMEAWQSRPESQRSVHFNIKPHLRTRMVQDIWSSFRCPEMAVRCH